MTLPEFLDKMNADLKNEWTHLQFYLYHAAAVAGLHAEEYSEFLSDSAKGEMDHVLAFTRRLIGLAYRQPASDGHVFPKFMLVEDILAHAILIESDVADNYAQRLAEIDELRAAHPTVSAYLTVFYEDQLKDSYEDCEKMRQIMASDGIAIARLTRPFKSVARGTPSGYPDEQ
jgi:hypothetical protein